MTTRPRIRGSLLTERRGIAAVEFALLAPLLLLLLMGVAEVGRFATFAIKVQHAANSVADLATAPPPRAVEGRLCPTAPP